MGFSDLARDINDNENRRIQRFENILLEPVQKTLLIQLAEIRQSIPRNQLTKFMYVSSSSGRYIQCPNNKTLEAYFGDIEALDREGLVALTKNSKPSHFDVTPLGLAYCDYLKEIEQFKKTFVDHAPQAKPDIKKESQDKTNEQEAKPSYDKDEQIGQRDKDKEGQNASIAGYGISDQATAVDKLGFEPYVNAVAEFLLHKDTKPPLTMSIEGEWGSGKSSFMLQLSKELAKRNALIVNFSPWRHDKEDSLWAAFTLSFAEALKKKVSWWKRPWKRVALACKRFDLWRGLPALLILFFKWAAYIIACVVIAIILFKENMPFLGDKTVKVLLTIIGPALLMWKAVKDINGVIGNPFKHDLEKYINAPDYASRVCFVERFHEDFKKVVDVYASGKRVFVFIDDLDRCEVPQAAELMKAINLMISDDPALFFILGLDRIKVAAGLAVKDKELIPYLAAKESSKASTEEVNRDAIQGLIYGSEFIEKFIQIPFHIPRADPAKLQEMLNIDTQEAPKISYKIFYRKPTDTGIANSRELRVNEKNQAVDSKNVAETPEEHENKEKLRRDVGLRLGTDSEEIKSIIQMVSKSLNCNPRRIKQFVNLFRLRAYIAFETGVLKYPANAESKGFITLEQLGKITAIAIQWPLLFKKAIENKDIIHMITCVAEGIKGEMDTSPIRPWWGDGKLMELVRANCQNDLRERYSLNGVDIDKLLEVLPRTSTIIPVELEEEVPRKTEQWDGWLKNQKTRESVNPYAAEQRKEEDLRQEFKDEEKTFGDEITVESSFLSRGVSDDGHRKGSCHIRLGNIFDAPCDMVVLACSAKGSISKGFKSWVDKYNIPMPLPMPLGDVQIIPFPGPGSLTRLIAWAASVLNDQSTSETIEAIGKKLGEYTVEHPDVRLIWAPLLGAGAGRLTVEVSAASLKRGFKSTAAEDATLVITAIQADVVERARRACGGN